MSVQTRATLSLWSHFSILSGTLSRNPFRGKLKLSSTNKRSTCRSCLNKTSSGRRPSSILECRRRMMNKQRSASEIRYSPRWRVRRKYSREAFVVPRRSPPCPRSRRLSTRGCKSLQARSMPCLRSKTSFRINLRELKNSWLRLALRRKRTRTQALQSRNCFKSGQMSLSTVRKICKNTRASCGWRWPTSRSS